jgi:hypothetical protein
MHRKSGNSIHRSEEGKLEKENMSERLMCSPRANVSVLL